MMSELKELIDSQWFPCLALNIQRETLALSQKAIVCNNTIFQGLIEDWLKMSNKLKYIIKTKPHNHSWQLFYLITKITEAI